MAQQVQAINLIAPGFKGVNTEDSPIAQDPSFAEIADNAIIDKRGRIAARNGFLKLTNYGDLGVDRVHKVHYFFDKDGNTDIFVCGNNKIFKTTTTDTADDTLTDITPLGYTITASNWRIVNFNEGCYFFQRGYEPLIYTTAGGLETFSDYTAASTPAYQQCHEALSAWGRMWIVDNNAQATTIYWSDLLQGTEFEGGSSGSIDVTKAWPDGHDKVRGLAAHNNLLIVFGNHSIIVYEGANSPATMQLADTVAGVGLVCRNSIQHIGTDVLFMSATGLRSFGRTIQEKSMPISDLSGNVKTELINVVTYRTEPTASIYSPEHSFYLISFPSENMTYCFDLRGTLENGAYRVTKWPSDKFKAYARKQDGTLIVGNSLGIGEYSGYTDDSETYRFRYYSPSLTFGDISRLKMLKKIKPTIVGANGADVSIKWGYDFLDKYNTKVVTIGSQTRPYYYSQSNYMLAYYTKGFLVSREQFNTTGSGNTVVVGIEAVVNGNPVSVQEVSVWAMIGKMT